MGHGDVFGIDVRKRVGERDPAAELAVESLWLGEALLELVVGDRDGGALAEGIGVASGQKLGIDQGPDQRRGDYRETGRKHALFDFLGDSFRGGMFDVRFLLQGSYDEGAVPGAGVLLVAGHDGDRAVGVQKRDLLRFYNGGLGALFVPGDPVVEVDGAGSGAVALFQRSRDRYGHVAGLGRLLRESFAQVHGDGVGRVFGVGRVGIVGGY